MSKVIEIPQGKRTPKYRFFEILPGFISILLIVLLFVFSMISSVLGAIYVLLIVMASVVKAIGITARTAQGYRLVKKALRVDWRQRLLDLATPEAALERLQGSKSDSYHFPIHQQNLRKLAHAQKGAFPLPKDVFHAIIISVYNETIDILGPTMESVLKTTFPKKRMFIVLAYEERGGKATEELALTLKARYGSKFGAFILAKHPDGVRGEVVGKGANITNAGKILRDFVRTRGLKYRDVIVTTLDSDNRPHPCYFDQVAYEYIVHEDRKHLSYQPVSLFTNNLWDAPAVARVIASSNSFWNLICTMRPHTLRNFASHSQPLDALVEMNFWSVRTIVEDGHQYWRSLFYFEGDYDVLPIRAPIYQDAVLAPTFLKTLKAQWKQLRRWDYGASDVAYVANYMFSRARKIPFWQLWPKFVRLLDGHVALAAISPIIAFGGWVPMLFRFQSRDLLAHNLPIAVSYVQTFAALGLFVSIILTLKLLPKRPAKYHATKSLAMVLQWVISPVIAVVYASACAFNSQIRLMFGWYMEKFDITVKSVKK